MNETRRLAYVSAVNIDGAEFNKINRSSDPFDLDPRLPESKQCGEWLYTDNDLDRGHLTRRQDPNWGSDADAQVRLRGGVPVHICCLLFAVQSLVLVPDTVLLLHGSNKSPVLWSV